MTSPISFWFLPITDYHQTGAKDSVTEFVTLLHLLQNDAFFARSLPDGFMQAGVKGFTQCRDGG
jgi:hypothetical protein